MTSPLDEKGPSGLLQKKLRERSGFMREVGHNDDADLDEEAADALDQAQSALAAMRVERDRNATEYETVLNSYADENQRLHDRAETAEAQVQRLTEELSKARGAGVLELADEIDTTMASKAITAYLATLPAPVKESPETEHVAGDVLSADGLVERLLEQRTINLADIVGMRALLDEYSVLHHEAATVIQTLQGEKDDIETKLEAECAVWHKEAQDQLSRAEAAESEVIRLTEEAARLDRILRASIPEPFKSAVSPVGAAQGYIAALETHIKALEEALRPFADKPDDWTVDQVNAARLLLKEGGE